MIEYRKGAVLLSRWECFRLAIRISVPWQMRKMAARNAIFGNRK